MKVMWGLAPFQQNNFDIKRMFEQIQILAVNDKNIHIGYVATGNESRLNTAYEVPYEERYTKYPQKIILDELHKAKVAINQNRIHVVHDESLSTTRAVDRFLTLAKSKKADLLALYTHGRKGLSRFFLGSFAETAIHRSEINLLIMNSSQKRPAQLKSIVYASDLSEKSMANLPEILKICKSTGARLTIFHAAEVTYKWSLDENHPEIQAYRESVNRSAEGFLEKCRRARVACEVEVKAEFKSTFEQILKSAKKWKADLIVVSAEAGPGAALMGGSVTRQIVRNGKYPVLVLKNRKGQRS